jgi:hypothetical protein
VRGVEPPTPEQLRAQVARSLDATAAPRELHVSTNYRCEASGRLTGGAGGAVRLVASSNRQRFGRIRAIGFSA